MAEQEVPVWAEPGWLPKKVLAPLDGSSESERALRKCLPLLRDTGAEVMLMAAVDAEDPGELSDPREVTDPAALAALEEALKRSEGATTSATAYLEGVRSIIGEANEVKVLVGYGDPSEAIADAAESEDADMLLMATRRESSLIRGIIGSTTSRVLHTVRKPVMVVRVEEEDQPVTQKWPQNIVTPLDVTEMSEWAIDPSISLAKASGAEIRFVRVTPRAYYPGAGGVLEYVGSGIFFGSELRGEAFEYLAPFVDRARAEGVDAYAEARSGSTAGEIVDIVRELPDAMVVMTTHARTGFLRLTLGSTADKVVRASAKPVLLLPINWAED